MVNKSVEKLKRFPIKSLLGVLDSHSSMCSDGDNGDVEDQFTFT